VPFSGETDHIKNKNQQSNIPSGPPKVLKLHETKEKHVVYLLQMNEKTEKGNM